MGVTTKVQIPEFGGNGSHPDVASAFRTWAHTITYYYEYYKDHYLMPLVVTSVKDNATAMFDFTCTLFPGEEGWADPPEDEGTLLWCLHLQKAKEHHGEPEAGCL